MASSKPAVVFVHGSWHNPNHFGPVRKVFESNGFQTECPEQPSASSLTLTDPLTDDAKTIHDSIADLINGGKDVIVVMHSYGGVIGTQAVTADLSKTSRQAKGLEGGIIHLVYVAAFIVSEGNSLGSALGGALPPYIKTKVSFPCPASREEGVLLMSLQDDGTCMMLDPALRFFNDLSKEEQDKWVSELRPVLTKTQFSPISNAGYKHYPVTYLYCDNDQALPPQVQKMMVETNGPHFKTESCYSSHSPFLSQPERVLQLVQGITN